MLTSLAFIFLVGLFMAAICQRLKLPRIIGEYSVAAKPSVRKNGNHLSG